jgi:hypothetical protein
MRFNKFAAFVSAASMAVLSAMPVMQANAAAPDLSDFIAEPVFEYFKASDVNGVVGVQLSDDLSAHVEITFDSPEGTAFPYYVTDIKSGGRMLFQIEGYSNTEDDYRSYHISIKLKGGIYNSSASEFVQDFTVPDGNDEPDSFVAVGYNFVVDDKLSTDDIEYLSTTKESGTYKNKKITGELNNYLVHLDGYIKGDVTGEGVVDGSDATLVLREFGAQLAGDETTLDPRQFAAADIDGNGTVDGSDATLILKYYGLISAGKEATWDDVIPKN